MTSWNYYVNEDGSMDVWDHNGQLVTSLTYPDGPRVLPGDVLDVMFQEAKASYVNGDTQRAIVVTGIMAGEQITEGKP